MQYRCFLYVVIYVRKFDTHTPICSNSVSLNVFILIILVYNYSPPYSTAVRIIVVNYTILVDTDCPTCSNAVSHNVVIYMTLLVTECPIRSTAVSL